MCMTILIETILLSGAGLIPLLASVRMLPMLLLVLMMRLQIAASVSILPHPGETRFAEYRLWAHPHAEYGQRSKERGPSEVNILDQ